VLGITLRARAPRVVRHVQGLTQEPPRSRAHVRELVLPGTVGHRTTVPPPGSSRRHEGVRGHALLPESVGDSRTNADGVHDRYGVGVARERLDLSRRPHRVLLRALVNLVDHPTLTDHDARLVHTLTGHVAAHHA